MTLHTKMDSTCSITYSSTRGGQKNLRFREVVMTGLAHDRGLFVPDSFPTVSNEELESWRSLSYSQLAVKVISLYVKDDEVPRRNLEDIVTRSCASFRSKDVTPVISVGGHYVLVGFAESEIFIYIYILLDYYFTNQLLTLMIM